MPSLIPFPSFVIAHESCLTHTQTRTNNLLTVNAPPRKRLFPPHHSFPPDHLLLSTPSCSSPNETSPTVSIENIISVSMQPLRSPSLPTMLAFHPPPITASLHCPPPITPTTPPPNDTYPPLLPPAYSHPSDASNPYPPSSSLLTHTTTPSTSLEPPTPKRPRPNLHSFTPSTSASTQKKKSRTSSAKYPHGLKDFTTTVASKLRFYGSASYTQLADELVKDAFDRLRTENLPFNQSEVDKNVRRRVYDALNVFSSMGFVQRTGKTVVWNGKQGFLRMVGMSPCDCVEPTHTCTLAQVTTQKRRNIQLNAILKEKRARLEELRHQQEYVQCIVRRNASRDSSRITTGNDVRVADDLEFKRPDHHRVDLPFIMVSTDPQTSVSLQMEHGKQSMVLDFDAAFRLWDGYAIAGRVVNRRHPRTAVLYDGNLRLAHQDAISARNQ